MYKWACLRVALSLHKYQNLMHLQNYQSNNELMSDSVNNTLNSDAATIAARISHGVNVCFFRDFTVRSFHLRWPYD